MNCNVCTEDIYDLVARQFDITLPFKTFIDTTMQKYYSKSLCYYAANQAKYVNDNGTSTF